MTNQHTKRPLIGFIAFSIVCLVLVVLAWQSPARHLWRIRREFASLASFPYPENDKLTAIHCLLGKNDPKALSLARTLLDANDKSRALAKIANAQNDPVLFKEALDVANTIKEVGKKAFTLIFIATKSHNTETMKQAFQLATQIKDTSTKLIALIWITEETSDAVIQQKILDAARTINEPEEKSRVLIAIAKAMNSEALFNEALYAVSGLPPNLRTGS